jgi:serine/threonine protein kinase
LYFPPEAFGPFRVLHQIGAGTLGPVFRAYEPADDRRDRLVAVKVFRLDLTPEQTAAFVDELETVVTANIHHPNIAAPIASGLEYGAPYLAQEYAVGDSLDVVLRERGRLSIQEVVTLVESLARAIDYAALRGVHHGLLHLRDIVVTADEARITGFGISAALSNIGGKVPTRPQYSAPDAASDVYALGAIAFEAATGKRASADNLKEFEAEHGSELRDAFGLPLADTPEMRPTRAGDFAAALRAAAPPNASTFTPESPIARPDESVVPIAPDDPLDPLIDLGASDARELDAPSDFIAESPSPTSTTVLPSAWAAPPPPARATNFGPEPDPTSRRWPIAAMSLAFAVFATLLVGFFLRSPRPTPATDQESGVDATVVDMPAVEPSSPNTTAGRGSLNAAPNARDQRVARSAPSPAPTPSRPASGAVRGAQTGSVLIRSTPADADVMVNGKPRGKTPLALRDLALGSYTIRVARDGYATEERTLELTARRPTTSTTINLRSSAARGASVSAIGASADGPADKIGSGGLNVQSRPPGARVFVNDRIAGSTPIAISGLPAGPATVRIEMDGYQPWTTTVSVSAGGQTRVAASLER